MSEQAMRRPADGATARMAVIRSVATVALRSALVVMVSELTIMYLLDWAGFSMGGWAALLDSMLLSIVALPALYVVILRPVTRLAAEQAAAPAEARFRAMTQSVQEGILVHNREGKIQFANPAIDKTFGYQAGTLVGANVESLMPPETVKQFREARERYAAAKEDTVIGRGAFEAEGQRKNGELFPVELSVSMLRAGKETQFVVVLRDITARKRDEKVLRESEALFRTMADHAPVMIWMAGPDDLCTYVNKGWREFSGRTLEQELGIGWTSAIHPEDYERFFSIARPAFATRQAFAVEYRMRRADGQYRWIFDRGRPWFLPDGSFAGYIGSCFDVTERRETEQALRQAEEKYRGIFHDAIVGIFQTTPDGRYLSVNPEMAKIYGYESPEELMASRTDIARQAYVDPQRREEFKRLMEERGAVRNFEYEVYRKDGARIWLLENARAVRDARGAVFYYIGTVEDVTERKHAEEALRASERKFRDLLEKLPVAVRIIQEGKVVFANSANARLYGFETPEELLPADPFALVAPEDVARMKDYARRRAAGEDVPRRYEVRGRRRDGSEFTAEAHAERILYEGAPASLLAIQDLTERQRLKMYEKILPVCCVCGKIRDDAGAPRGEGDWGKLEDYLAAHSDAQFSHTFCPACLEEYRRKEGLK